MYPRLDMADLRSTVYIPQGVEIRTMDKILLTTFAITAGLLIGLWYYLGRQRILIDNIGYMVASLMDHLHVPMEDCGECDYCLEDGPYASAKANNGETLMNNPNGVDSFRDTLSYAGFGSPDNQHPRYGNNSGWQSWDERVWNGEEE